ncbi:MAG: hypothetical protein IJ083_11910 [Clostridia bacterium]|nr:hypothetical protein [Clostridia bacterium]
MRTGKLQEEILEGRVISLIAGRGFGKTTLLRETERQLMDHHPVYLSLRVIPERSFRDEESFVAALSAALSLYPGRGEMKRMTPWEKLAGRMDESGKGREARILLCDDVELLDQTPVLQPFIRFLYTSTIEREKGGRVCFSACVLCGRRAPEEMKLDGDRLPRIISGSSVSLTLTLEEVVGMMCAWAEEHGVTINAREVATRIWQESGGHPRTVCRLAKEACRGAIGAKF